MRTGTARGERTWSGKQLSNDKIRSILFFVDQIKTIGSGAVRRVCNMLAVVDKSQSINYAFAVLLRASILTKLPVQIGNPRRTREASRKEKGNDVLLLPVFSFPPFTGVLVFRAAAEKDCRKRTITSSLIGCKLLENRLLEGEGEMRVLFFLRVSRVLIGPLTKISGLLSQFLLSALVACETCSDWLS